MVAALTALIARRRRRRSVYVPRCPVCIGVLTLADISAANPHGMCTRCLNWEIG